MNFPFLFTFFTLSHSIFSLNFVAQRDTFVIEALIQKTDFPEVYGKAIGILKGSYLIYHYFRDMMMKKKKNEEKTGRKKKKIFAAKWLKCTTAHHRMR